MGSMIECNIPMMANMLADVRRIDERLESIGPIDDSRTSIDCACLRIDTAPGGLGLSLFGYKQDAPIAVTVISPDWPTLVRAFEEVVCPNFKVEWVE